MKLKWKQQKQNQNKRLDGWIWTAEHAGTTYKIERGLEFWHVYRQGMHIGEFPDKQQCMEHCNALASEDK